MSISVVIPLRDAADVIAPLLVQLQPLRGSDFEVIVVEAEPPLVGTAVAEPGADPGPPGTLMALADRWLFSPPGRALQLRAGADAATHGLLWFLHADSRGIEAPAAWLRDYAIAADRRSDKGAWGRFDVGFDDAGRLLRCVAWFMNRRSRLTRVCTGDQGIWVSRRLLTLAGGWPVQPLMEDVELSKRLRALVTPALPALKGAPILTTSARRFRRDGVWPTIRLMWWLRLRYAFGGEPQTLHALYYGASSGAAAPSAEIEPLRRSKK